MPEDKWNIPIELVPVGFVDSPVTEPERAPKQADEGAPEATIVLEDRVVAALDGVRAGDEMLVLTWLHLAPRDVLRVHPRGDTARPLEGVFGTRSPGRPNPIGLHRVEVVAIEGRRVRVRGLEAIDGSPVVDLKPVLSADAAER